VRKTGLEITKALLTLIHGPGRAFVLTFPIRRIPCLDDPSHRLCHYVVVGPADVLAPPPHPARSRLAVPTPTAEIRRKPRHVTVVATISRDAPGTSSLGRYPTCMHLSREKQGATLPDRRGLLMKRPYRLVSGARESGQVVRYGSWSAWTPVYQRKRGVPMVPGIHEEEPSASSTRLPNKP